MELLDDRICYGTAYTTTAIPEKYLFAFLCKFYKGWQDVFYYKYTVSYTVEGYTMMEITLLKKRKKC